MLRHSHANKNRPFPTDNQKAPGFREYKVGTAQLVMKRGMLPTESGTIYPAQYNPHNNVRPGIEGGNKQRSNGRMRHEDI